MEPVAGYVPGVRPVWAQRQSMRVGALLGVQRGRVERLQPFDCPCRVTSTVRVSCPDCIVAYRPLHVVHSRMSIACASRSRSKYGSPLTLTLTCLMTPPVNR